MSAEPKDPKAAQRAYEAQMVRTAAHPVRAKALSMMAKRPSSPKEIAEAVEKPIGNVTYHVRALERAGMAMLVEEKKRGGATEHFYVAVNISTEEAGALGPKEREMLARMTLHLIIGEAAQAIETGAWGARPDRVIARIPLYLDEAGWKEVGEIYERALEVSLEVQAKCAERLDRRGEKGFRGLAAILMFEMSGRPERD